MQAGRQASMEKWALAMYCWTAIDDRRVLMLMMTAMQFYRRLIDVSKCHATRRISAHHLAPHSSPHTHTWGVHTPILSGKQPQFCSSSFTASTFCLSTSAYPYHSSFTPTFPIRLPPCPLSTAGRSVELCVTSASGNRCRNLIQNAKNIFCDIRTAAIPAEKQNVS